MSSRSNNELKEEFCRKEVIRITGAESDVCDSLEIYARILIKWQKRFNLIGRSTLKDIWGRHFLDCAQLFPFVTDLNVPILDLGSGAGFPGLVLSAIGVQGVHLIERDVNKTEFMRQVIRETGATASLHRARIETYSGPRAGVVISRACAPLSRLLNYSQALSKDMPTLLFLKGRNWRGELTESQTLWHIDYRCHISCTDPNGVILEINEFHRK